MKYAITTTLLLFALALGAQSPDMERMKRDIEVGENILASLLQEEYEGVKVYSPGLLLGNRSNVEGSYLEGFGVLFTIAPGHFIGSINWGDGQYSFSQDHTIVIPRAEARAKQGRSNGVTVIDTLYLESQFKEVVRTFVADYAYLLRQVPANEKILIRYGGQAAHFETWGVVAGFGEGSKNVYSAVIEKSDLDAHQNSRLSREQLLERIKFTAQEEGSGKEDRDLTLLTSIFSRLYQSDLSSDEIFRVRRSPNYEAIEGLGAVVYLTVDSKMALHSLYFNGISMDGWNSRGFNLVVPDRSEDEEKADEKIDQDVDPEEKAEAIDEAYPEFLAELQRNIIEYGSIVKNLAEDEALIFRVKFFDCKECKELPEKVEITARQSTLEAFRKGSLALDKAVEQLKVTVEE